MPKSQELRDSAWNVKHTDLQISMHLLIILISVWSKRYPIRQLKYSDLDLSCKLLRCTRCSLIRTTEFKSLVDSSKIWQCEKHAALKELKQVTLVYEKVKKPRISWFFMFCFHLCNSFFVWSSFSVFFNIIIFLNYSSLLLVVFSTNIINTYILNVFTIPYFCFVPQWFIHV